MFRYIRFDIWKYLFEDFSHHSSYGKKLIDYSSVADGWKLPQVGKFSGGKGVLPTTFITIIIPVVSWIERWQWCNHIPEIKNKYFFLSTFRLIDWTDTLLFVNAPWKYRNLPFIRVTSKAYNFETFHMMKRERDNFVHY